MINSWLVYYFITIYLVVNLKLSNKNNENRRTITSEPQFQICRDHSTNNLQISISKLKIELFCRGPDFSRRKKLSKIFIFPENEIIDWNNEQKNRHHF